MVKSLAHLTYCKILLSYYTKLIYHQKRTTDYCTQILSLSWLLAKILNILAEKHCRLLFFVIYSPFCVEETKKSSIIKNN